MPTTAPSTPRFAAPQPGAATQGGRRAAAQNDAQNDGQNDNGAAAFAGAMAAQALAMAPSSKDAKPASKHGAPAAEARPVSGATGDGAVVGGGLSGSTVASGSAASGIKSNRPKNMPPEPKRAHSGKSHVIAGPPIPASPAADTHSTGQVATAAIPAGSGTADAGVGPPSPATAAAVAAHVLPGVDRGQDTQADLTGPRAAIRAKPPATATPDARDANADPAHAAGLDGATRNDARRQGTGRQAGNMALPNPAAPRPDGAVAATMASGGPRVDLRQPSPQATALNHANGRAGRVKGVGQTGAGPLLAKPTLGADKSKDDDPARHLASALDAPAMPAPPTHQRMPPPNAPALPDLPRHAAGQVAQAVLHHGPGQTEIRLDPAELGHVRISLDSGHDSVTVTIHAARHDTAALLRRHADMLTQEFRAVGYRDVTFSFSGGQAGQDRQPPPPPMTVPATEPAPMPATLPDAPQTTLPSAAPRRGVAGGLDLRI